MDKHFLPLLFPDFFQKISNFSEFSYSSNKFPDFLGVVGGNSKAKKEGLSEGNTENAFGWWL